jgi:hypothetical protein
MQSALEQHWMKEKFPHSPISDYSPLINKDTLPSELHVQPATRQRPNIDSSTTISTVLQTHINFPRFLPIFPDFLERLSHLAPIY